jgi:hypothetical protein
VPLFTQVRGIGILGSCASSCNPPYLSSLYNWAGLESPSGPPFGEWGKQVSQQSTNRSFDDLARALAEGSISRRRALKLFAGTAIAALIPSRALAGDDDDCVRVCHVPFDPDTEDCDFANAVTRCVSRRERRRHLENHPCDCRGRCANCLCLPINEPCGGHAECCSGNCFTGICFPNIVNCTCQDGQILFSRCTTAACGDTTTLNQFCNSSCFTGGHGSGVAGECFQEACGN